jgi:hypothetical protein
VAVVGSGGGSGGNVATGGTITAPGTAGHLTPFYASYTLTGGTSGWLRLHNGTTGYGDIIAAHGTPDVVGPFVAGVAGAYTVKLYGTSAASGTALATSGAITVS